MPTKDILIVDDEESICELISNSLQLAGYTPKWTTSPTKALEIIENDNYKVIISDIRMPEMTGVDLLRSSKNIDPLIQFIMITGYVEMSQILDAFRLGANTVLFKPFESIDMILVEVEHAIKRIELIKSVLKERKNLKAS